MIMPNDPFNQNASYPDPSQMSMGYNYSQQYNPSYSNMMYMNMNQSQLQQTMQVAQTNFHNHMQSVLQGTMAAGMSVYGQAQKVGSAFQERAYNDLYFGSGKFAVERSTWRDMSWGMGLAGSDFGRSMKIGGRRPEFISPEEYDFTMQRSWHHRKGELLDQVISGGGAAASSVGGMYLTRPLGMLRGLGVGMALDATVGNLISSVWTRPREYERGFREFTEVTDFSNRATQGRMSEDGSSRLASSFYRQESSPWVRAGFGMIPIVGDYLGKAVEKRLTPDTMPSETFKKMSSLGLLRDIDPNDVEKIDANVKNTMKIIEKFAGLANTTKDAILQMKASFNNMGFNGGQQDTMLSNLTKTSLSTGIHIDQLLPMAQTYASMGYNSGFNKSIVAQSGLNELSAIKAMQEYGLIDRMQDAGTLSQMHLMTAQNFVKSGWGKVSTFGGGSTAAAANYYRSRGTGSSAIGMAFEDIDGYAPDVDPIAAARGGWLLAKKRLGGGIKGTAGVISAFGGTREEKNQIYNSIYGLDELGEMYAAGTAVMKRAEKTGDYSNVAAFDVMKYTNTKYAQNPYAQGTTAKVNSLVNGVLGAKGYSEDTEKGEYLRSRDYGRQQRSKVEGLYKLMLDISNPGEAESRKRELVDEALKNRSFNSREEAERGINLALKDIDSSRGTHWYKFGYEMKLGDVQKASNYSLTYEDLLIGRKSRRNSTTDGAYQAFGKLFSKDSAGVLDYLVKKMGNGKDNVAVLNSYVNDRVKHGLITKEEAGQIINRNYMDNELAFDLVKEQIKIGSSEANKGIDNYYNIIKSKDSYRYGDGSGQINRQKLGAHIGDFQSQITGLKGMTGAQMRDWIHGSDGQKYLNQNLRAIYGEDKGSKLWTWFNEQSQNDPEAFRKKFMDSFVTNGAVVSDADFKKAGIDPTSNPNTVALSEFTTALKALNKVLGAT